MVWSHSLTLARIHGRSQAKYPHTLIEASGGITQDNIVEYFHESVDVISLGLLSQSVPHIDYSLKIRHAQQ